MSVQSILVLTGIVSAFLVFGVSLAWADFYCQRRPKVLVDEQQGYRGTQQHQNSNEERRAA